jgi:flagellar biosynthesis protein FliQ
MTTPEAVEMIRSALMCAFWISLPILVTAFLAGFLLSMLQILFSAQDPSFGSVPRLAFFFVGLILFLPWMVRQATHYCVRLLSDFSRYGNG